MTSPWESHEADEAWTSADGVLRYARVGRWVLTSVATSSPDTDLAHRLFVELVAEARRLPDGDL